MHIANGHYAGALRTNVTHLASGAQLHTDAPKDNHGKGEAFSPTDLCAVSLGSCLVTVMGIHARAKGTDLDGMSWTIEKVMAANPRRIDKIRIEISWPNAALQEANLIAELKDIALNCPVAKSLSAGLEQEILFHW